MLKNVRSTNKHSASSFSVPTNKQVTVRAPSLNIYRRQFKFHPQISIVPFLFLLNHQITEISSARADKVRCDLLTADANYTDHADLDDSTGQDDFLLALPLHRHLFSQHTRPVHSAYLLIAMDNRRSCGVNITTLSLEILEIVATKVVKTSLTPLDNIVSLHRS
jgi:hypothetical protein